MNDVDSTLITAERYKSLPPILVRAFIHDSIDRLDDSAKEYYRYVGKTMDYVREELQGLLRSLLEETDSFGGE
jgi:phosphoserine phosphatase